MREHFPPLGDLGALPRRALVIAPHPDDEVLGVGGVLAFHAARGDELRVVVVSDGGALAAPGAERAALAARREAESRAAAADLGVRDLRFLGLADGALERQGDLAAVLARELDAFAPELVYAPSPFELHPDHRAVSRAACAALAGGAARRVLFYGVNVPLATGVLFDVTPWSDQKRAALARFASQRSDLAAAAEAADRARTLNIDLPGVRAAEGFVDCASARVLDYEREVLRAVAAGRGGAAGPEPAADPWACTAVLTSFDKCRDVCENLAALRAQVRPFAAIVVVDNASSDGTAAAVRERFPEVRLIEMPHSAYGACETFNIGFATARTPLVAILDDDVVLPPHWLERMVARLAAEPESTALVSCEVEEPGMPPGYLDRPELRRERYMSTFRGCASLARLEALRRAGFYDERLFIYGNERDLTCRLLNLGFRVLHYPEVRAFHKTPFGIKLGKRSLYYHARNAWMTMLKYAPASALLRLPWLVLTRVVLRGEQSEREGAVADATGTIGIGRSLRETPGAWRVVLKAGLGVLANVPYCLKHRAPCRAPDFELPLK